MRYVNGEAWTSEGNGRGKAALGLILALAVTVALSVAACSGAAPGATGTTPAASEEDDQAADAAHIVEDAAVVLPTLTAQELAQDERLRVVATTNLVADVVARVGGDAIDLSTLIPLGVDPHSYTATPQDLRALSDAHVVFINGLGLEEALLPALGSLDGSAPLAPVNAGVPTIEFGAEDYADEDRADEGAADEADADAEHEHGVDPHTWLDVMNVAIWADNVATVLSELDPDNADVYRAAAADYRAELEALDADLRAQIATVPEDARKVVTDHDALGYFAAAYDLVIVGAVVPAYSTMAAPSAQELAALQDQIEAAGVPAIFVGTTVNPNLADQIADDLGIAVVPLYTGSLSEADGPAATYVDMMRYDVNAIVEALQP